MKKSYKSITAFLVLLSMVALKLGAQPLSGVVTINNTLPSSATNFTSFTAFAASLNTNGISGPLTVNVSNAVYTEQVAFNSITGTSATNTITINGNGSTLTFNGSSSGAHTFWCNGVDYMSVNNLNMVGTNGTYAMVLVFSNQSNYNNFSACTFSCPANGTGSYQVPVSWSASNQFLSASGDDGNYNTIRTSTLSNGYYAIWHYGITTNASFTHDNGFYNCRITDFYQYCMYNYYAKNFTVKNCSFDRDTRTNLTYIYFYYGWYNQGLMFDGNVIRDLYAGNTAYSSSQYMFYYLGYGASDLTNRNTIRNNIVRNMNWNGTTYMFYYNYYGNNDYIHNTFSFDNTTSTSSGVYLFYYCYNVSGTGTGHTFYNNLFSITQAGTGTKIIYYSPSNAMSSLMNGNDYNVTSTNGYIGYISSQTNSLPSWQTQIGGDVNSYTFAPSFVSLATGDLHPTNSAMNNLGIPLNVPVDQTNSPRSQLTPDIGALEFLSNNCSGVPSGLSVGTPTYALCPGNNANLVLNGFTSDLGIVYQWYTSTTSTLGPWTPISGANSVVYTTPAINATTYYGVSANCTLTGATSTVGGVINIAGTTTSVVPYLEDFENVHRNNDLPNCSWSTNAGALGSTALTYTSSNTLGRTPHSGNRFASFFYTPAGQTYYYTNGIQLNTGITYSASLWYQTEYYGYTNWTDLSILYGTTQTTTGLVPICTSNGPAVSNVYKPLSGTFTVPTSGLYYVAVRGTATSGSAQYLSWDDLSITIPCSVNSPTMSLVSNSTSICNGDQLALTASGADSYTWSTGSNANSITDMPNQNMVYTVWGINATTGCVATMTQAIVVNPIPSVFAYASNASVCQGQSTNLSAIGNAVSYAWSNSMTGQMITVTPAASTAYSVVGTNAYGCIATAVAQIAVINNPTINVSSSQPNDMCMGETQMLTATGGISYQWASSTGGLYQGNIINISPMVSTVYTVTGTGANGCSNKTTINQSVAACTGIKENSLNAVRVFPNPTSGEITLVMNNNSEKTITVTDVTGRIVSTDINSLDVVKMNISNLANGVYYVKVQSASSTSIVKVVKN